MSDIVMIRWGVVCLGKCYLRGVLHQLKLIEYDSLFILLSNALICRDEIDSWIWKPCPSGEFSLKSFYKALYPSVVAQSPFM